jgi:predicted RNA-binding Zn-ribbon protein involved in translation (DUF1610 family)
MKHGVDMLCPSCGIINILDFVPMAYDSPKCVDCGAALRVDPPPPDALHFSGTKALEKGAAQIRERVADIKRKRGD